jgi:hypothetical protein
MATRLEAFTYVEYRNPLPSEFSLRTNDDDDDGSWGIALADVVGKLLPVSRLLRLQ